MHIDTDGQPYQFPVEGRIFRRRMREMAGRTTPGRMRGGRSSFFKYFFGSTGQVPLQSPSNVSRPPLAPFTQGTASCSNSHQGNTVYFSRFPPDPFNRRTFPSNSSKTLLPPFLSSSSSSPAGVRSLFLSICHAPPIGVFCPVLPPPAAPMLISLFREMSSSVCHLH